MTITAAYNVETLRAQLSHTQYLQLLSAAVITLLAIIVMRVTLTWSLVTPPERLVTLLQLAHRDKQRPGEQVDHEVRQPATTSNVMTTE